jgi:hypothetical protein
VVDIICDTNIWRHIANGEEVIPEADRLIPNYTNHQELVKAKGVVTQPEVISDALELIGRRNPSCRCDPPLVYLKLLDSPDFEYDLMGIHVDVFVSAAELAKGERVEPGSQAEYFKRFEDGEKALQEFADLANKFAKPIKDKKLKAKDHRKEDSTMANQELISQWVGMATGTEGLSESFDWSKVELLMGVMRVWFNNLELTPQKVKPNDLFDFFQLAYVHPGEKYWTNEKSWNNLMKLADLGHYQYVV